MAGLKLEYTVLRIFLLGQNVRFWLFCHFLLVGCHSAARVPSRAPSPPIEKKVTNGSARVGISDEWPVEPTDHWIIPVQSRSEYKVSLTHPPPWMGPDGTCWMRERPARPPKEGFPSFVGGRYPT
jgi:hypothetical protein